MFSIDGTPWDVPCQIEREAQMQASEISGMLLDRTYFNDVLGTYMNYQVSIAVPFNKISLFYAIYEKLTDPVEAHTFVLPYNGSTITITARVESVSDSWVRMPGDENYWKSISFSVTAIHPSRSYRLTDAISRGRPVVPTIDGDRPAVLEPLTVTANGTYSPETGVDGFDEVTVNVRGSGIGLIEEWDFTQSTKGKIRGLQPTLHGGATQSENVGIVFRSASSLGPGYVAFDDVIKPYLGMTMEIDVADMNWQQNVDECFISVGDKKASDRINAGLYWGYDGSNKHWIMSDGLYSTPSGVYESFDHSSIKVHIDTDDHWHVYKDNVLIFEPRTQVTVPLDYLRLGSTELSLISTTITGVRIY